MFRRPVPAWFEIPVEDLERATRFYEAVLTTTLVRDPMGAARLALFPAEKPNPTGALIKASDYAPGESGTVVYLNLADIRPALQRVVAAGGRVLRELTELPAGMGVFAQIRDSEGNRVGLYSAA